MKVSFVQDYDIFMAEGGGERSDRACFIEGIRRGHELSLVNPENFSWDTINQSDLLIISNAARFDRNFLLRISQAKQYVNYNHDFFQICHWRLFYPMLEKCKRCKNLPFARQIMLNAKLNVFLSPLHFDSWCWLIPELRDRPHHLHPSPVDTEMFKPLDVPRKPNSVIGAGNCLLPFKGRDNVLKYAREHPELTFTFFGAKGDVGRLPDNCAFIGRVDYSKLPSMYSQAEHFIHLPASPQPCERSAIEGKLCGIPKFIVNPLVGITSFDFWREDVEKFREHIRNAAPNFWIRIEEVMS